MIFMGRAIFGMSVKRLLENIMHAIIAKEKPANMPKLKGMQRLKPTFAALFIDIILLGPGV